MRSAFAAQRLLLIPCVGAAIFAGCAPAPPNIDATQQLNRATGVAGAIQFRSEGGELDVGNVDQPLTVAAAVRQGLSNSPEVQAALARVESARADSTQARLLPNPVLSVVFRFPEGGGNPDIEAGLAADLVSLLRRRGQVSAADGRLRGAAAAAVTETLDALASVQESYVAVQTQDGLIAVFKERLGIVDRLLSVARDRLTAGEGTRLDVLALESQRLELLSDVADQELERRDQRLALARLLGTPSAVADWTLSPRQPNPTFTSTESQWIELSLTNRPEIQTRNLELQALGVDLSQTRFAPFDGAEVGAEGERDDEDWAVGPAVQVPLPIFDLGQARQAKARAAVIEARHLLIQARRKAVEDTRRAYAALEGTEANLLRVRDELLPLLARRYEQAEAQFRAGQTDITGLLLAEEELRSGRTRLVELERRNSEALIRLQRAVGGPGIFPTPAPASRPTTLPATAPAQAAGNQN